MTAPARTDDDDLAALFGGPGGGPLAAPGTYRVQLAKRVDGVLTPLDAPQTFAAAPLQEPTLGSPDRAARLAFQQRVARLQRAVLGSAQALTESSNRLGLLKQAVDQAPAADSALRAEIIAAEDKVRALQTELSGDRTVSTRSEPVAPGHPGPGAEHRAGELVVFGDADRHPSPRLRPCRTAVRRLAGTPSATGRGGLQADERPGRGGGGGVDAGQGAGLDAVRDGRTGRRADGP